MIFSLSLWLKPETHGLGPTGGERATYQNSVMIIQHKHSRTSVKGQQDSGVSKKLGGALSQRRSRLRESTKVAHADIHTTRFDARSNTVERLLSTELLTLELLVTVHRTTHGAAPFDRP